MKNRFLTLKGLGVSTAAALAGAAHAALPEGLTTAVTTYQTDATTAIAAVMGAGVIVWGLLKLKSKLGW